VNARTAVQAEKEKFAPLPGPWIAACSGESERSADCSSLPALRAPREEEAGSSPQGDRSVGYGVSPSRTKAMISGCRGCLK
jgi:hypothetical protein